jgi:hypothetical protein
MKETQQVPLTADEPRPEAAALGKLPSREDIKGVVRDQLSGVAWAPFFEQRAVTHKLGRTGIIADGLSTDEVLGYAAAYNRCRSTMVAGPDRSARMEQIFRDMRSAVRNIQVSDSGIMRALREPSNDRGIRLAAYAYLIEHPVPDLAALLVNVAANEDKPFGQYCALRAAKKLVEASTTRLTPELTAQLNEIAIVAGRGTDRAREVASILAEGRNKLVPTT